MLRINKLTMKLGALLKPRRHLRTDAGIIVNGQTEIANSVDKLAQNIQTYCDVSRSLMGNGPVIGFDADDRKDYVSFYSLDDNDDYDETEYETLDELRFSLGNISEQNSYSSGDVIYDQKVAKTEFFLKGTEQNSSFVNVGTLKKLNVPNVISYCVPAPFGDLKHMVTKIDPEVRLAVECTSDRMQCDDSHLVSAIKKNVLSNLLFGDENNDIDIVLHKLNVYSTGGHFKSHTDTPTHDPALFIGTVVVCLPSEHTGGDLIIRHKGDQKVYDFAKQSKNKIQFAAFYGDCEHEVLPVSSGHRVTLTYSILRRGTGSSDGDNNSVVPKMNIIEKVKQTAHENMLTKFEKHINEVATKYNGYIGFFLSHCYTRGGLMAANLKGSDRALYSYFANKNMPVSFVPVVSSYNATWPYEDDVTMPETFNVKLLTLNDCEDLRHEAHKNIPNAKHTPFLSADANHVITIKDEERRPEHMGNHVEDGSIQRIYLKSAMIVGPFDTKDDATDCATKEEKE